MVKSVKSGEETHSQVEWQKSSAMTVVFFFFSFLFLYCAHPWLRSYLTLRAGLVSLCETHIMLISFSEGKEHHRGKQVLSNGYSFMKNFRMQSGPRRESKVQSPQPHWRTGDCSRSKLIWRHFCVYFLKSISSSFCVVKQHHGLGSHKDSICKNVCEKMEETLNWGHSQQRCFYVSVVISLL